MPAKRHGRLAQRYTTTPAIKRGVRVGTKFTPKTEAPRSRVSKWKAKANEIAATRPNRAAPAAGAVATMIRALAHHSNKPRAEVKARAPPVVDKKPAHTGELFKQVAPPPAVVDVKNKDDKQNLGAAAAGVNYSRNVTNPGPRWSNARKTLQCLGGRNVVVIDNMEPLGEVKGTVSFEAKTLPLGPIADWLTWLKYEAAGFDLYLFLEVEVMFITEAPTSARGRLMMNWETDVTDVVPIDRKSFEVQQGTKSVADWKNKSCRLPIKQTMHQNFYFVGGPTLAGQQADLHEVLQARFQYATSDFADTSVFGELWIKYKVALGRTTAGQTNGAAVLAAPYLYVVDAVPAGAPTESADLHVQNILQSAPVPTGTGNNGNMPKGQVNVNVVAAGNLAGPTGLGGTQGLSLFFSPSYTSNGGVYTSAGGAWCLDALLTGVTGTLATNFFCTGQRYQTQLTVANGAVRHTWLANNGIPWTQRDGDTTSNAASSALNLGCSYRVDFPVGRSFTGPPGYGPTDPFNINNLWAASGIPYARIDIFQTAGVTTNSFDTGLVALKYECYPISANPAALGYFEYAEYAVRTENDTSTVYRKTRVGDDIVWQPITSTLVPQLREVFESFNKPDTKQREPPSPYVDVKVDSGGELLSYPLNTSITPVISARAAPVGAPRSQSATRPKP